MIDRAKPDIPLAMTGKQAYAAGKELGKHVRRTRRFALLALDIRENVDLVFGMHRHYALIRTGFTDGYLDESKMLQL